MPALDITMTRPTDSVSGVDPRGASDGIDADDETHIVRGLD